MRQSRGAEFSTTRARPKIEETEPQLTLDRCWGQFGLTLGARGTTVSKRFSGCLSKSASSLAKKFFLGFKGLLKRTFGDSIYRV